MQYYDETQYLAVVNRRDEVVGQVEKWEAHKKGKLHRAFTIALIHNNNVILQHRKHPLYDGVIDLTCSSHPVYVGDQLQDMEKAAYATLQREWNIQKKSVTAFKDNGTVYYKAKDPLSSYVEHEMCHLLVADIDHIPHNHNGYAYGSTTLPVEKLKNRRFPIYSSLAPWAQKLIKLL